MEKYIDDEFFSSKIEEELRIEKRQYERSTAEYEHDLEFRQCIDTDVKEENGYNKLRLKLDDEGLRRIEESCREEEDFENLIKIWNRRLSNAERRSRYWEVGRSEVPLDYNEATEPFYIPRYLNNEFRRNLKEGNYIDIIYDCPHEIEQLVTNPIMSEAISMLSQSQKELLQFKVVRKYTTEEVALYKQQSDRNIRKVYSTVLKHIRKNYIKIYDERKRRDRSDDRYYEKCKRALG